MNTPERIYLVDPDTDESEDAGPGMAPETEGVYWCEDRIHKSDVEYIRADVAAPPGWKRTPNGWERTGEEEPVAWRVRYRSEPGMIGHYPFSYTDRKPIRSLENPAYEVEPLYTHPAQTGAALEAQERDALKALQKISERMKPFAGYSMGIASDIRAIVDAALSAGGRGGKAT